MKLIVVAFVLTVALAPQHAYGQKPEKLGPLNKEQFLKRVPCMVCKKAVNQLRIDQENGLDLAECTEKGLLGCESSEKLAQLAAAKLISADTVTAAKTKCKELINQHAEGAYGLVKENLTTISICGPGGLTEEGLCPQSLQDFELQVMKNLKCRVCERAVQQLIMDQNNGTVDQNNGTDLDARIAKGLAGCENSQKLNDIAEKAPKLAAAAKDECKTLIEKHAEEAIVFLEENPGLTAHEVCAPGYLNLCLDHEDHDHHDHDHEDSEGDADADADEGADADADEGADADAEVGADVDLEGDAAEP